MSGIARFDTCYNTVAINNRLIGKQGHSGFLSLRGYGNLFRDNTDSIDIGQFHGPGVQSWDSTTVILRNVIATGARLESHSNIVCFFLVVVVVVVVVSCMCMCVCVFFLEGCFSIVRNMQQWRIETYMYHMYSLTASNYIVGWYCRWSLDWIWRCDW